MQVKELIQGYLKAGHVMQLATVRDGQPWCCNLHFITDDDANLYWISTLERRHSQEISDDKRVAAAIAVQTDEDKPGAPVIGIQVEGDAELVDDPEEVKRIVDQYIDYHKKDETFYQRVMTGEKAHRLYRLKPRLYALFDLEHFPKNPRQEWRPAGS